MLQLLVMHAFSYIFHSSLIKCSWLEYYTNYPQSRINLIKYENGSLLADSQNFFNRQSNYVNPQSTTNKPDS
jgi:hypothetical protein